MNYAIESKERAKTLMGKVSRKARDSFTPILLWRDTPRPAPDNGGNRLHASKLLQTIRLGLSGMGVFGHSLPTPETSKSCWDDSCQRADFGLYRDGALVCDPCRKRPDSSLLYSSGGLLHRPLFGRNADSRNGERITC